MELINMFLNMVAPSITLAALASFLPLYLLFKFLHFLIRSIYAEDVAGKVVLITGASSGIGKHLAYEYARRGACLALVARREPKLREVATQAELIGSPNAIAIRGDVSKVEDCKHFVHVTVEHFGRMDHLVTNAGVASMCLFEDYTDITKPAPAMDINFWGSVYSTYFAIPHLKQSKGKIIAVTSLAGWLPSPRMSFYNASKAAAIALYETLRVELGGDIGITIVTPGLIKSEITGGKFLNKAGKLEVDEELRDVQISLLPVQSTEECAKAIVNSACRGDAYLTHPSWVRVTYYWKVFWPELVEWFNRKLLMNGTGTSERDTLSKKILDITNDVKEFLTPGTVPFDELKTRLDYQRLDGLAGFAFSECCKLLPIIHRLGHKAKDNLATPVPQWFNRTTLSAQTTAKSSHMHLQIYSSVWISLYSVSPRALYHLWYMKLNDIKGSSHITWTTADFP